MQPDILPENQESEGSEIREIVERLQASQKEAETQIRFSKQLSEQAVKITGDRLKKAGRLQKYVDEVHQSDQILRDLQGALQAIQSKTKAINSIVMKLQLLSFNASIEASRAAQYGKGFSVVAEEVGRLAQTSGQAAREIEVLVNTCHEQTNRGMDEILEKSSRSVTACRELLSGLSDVSTCVDGVASALVQIDQVSTAQALEMDKLSLKAKRKTIKIQAPVKAVPKPEPVEERAPLIDVQSIDADDPSFKIQD